MAIVGLILGIVAIGLSWYAGAGSAALALSTGSTALPTILCIAALVLAIVGLILSISARKSMRAAGRSTGLATAGMVIGIIAVVVCAIFLVGCVLLNGAIASAVS